MNSATPTYREAKARLKTLPAAEQDAFLRRLITYKSEVDRAGAAWQDVSFVGMLGGIALVLLAG